MIGHKDIPYLKEGDLLVYKDKEVVRYIARGYSEDVLLVSMDSGNSFEVKRHDLKMPASLISELDKIKAKTAKLEELLANKASRENAFNKAKLLYGKQ